MLTFIVEDKPIFAHRCILMARCEPLERMLDGPMRESQQSEIVLKEQTHEVFLALLEYIYTDTVEGLDPRNVSITFFTTTHTQPRPIEKDLKNTHTHIFAKSAHNFLLTLSMLDTHTMHYARWEFKI